MFSRHNLANAYAVVLPSLFYLFKGGGAVALWILILSSLLLLAINPALRRTVGVALREHRRLVVAFVSYTLVCASIDVIHGHHLGAFERYIMWILALPVLAAFYDAGPREELLGLGAALASTAAAVQAAHAILVLGIFRPSIGMTNPILFGAGNLLIAVLCLALLVHSKHSVRWKLVFAIGALAGISASLMSGSKGGWVTLPVVLIVFIAMAVRQKGRLQIAALAGIVLVGGVVAAMPGSPVATRLAEAKDELISYASTAHLPLAERQIGGSVGVRLEQYRLAMALGNEAPWIGISNKDLHQAKQVVAAEKGIAPVATTFWGFHNEILDHYVHYGITGTLALIAFYVMVARHFAKSYDNIPATSASSPMSVFGAFIPLLLFEFGLTNPMMLFADSRYAFAFWITMAALCLHSMRHRPHQAT